ncbi:hypothetical protein EVAR_43083_1 [Eumeta japonica]|uniref:Uncharacterized protein n=1 Tax=Eumeta variegata TaxID=151549 RepID=A0A4C1WV74_EUMVA|nr:hypothetical protein EVAR_43083_1 [Eumeta japonica]
MATETSDPGPGLNSNFGTAFHTDLGHVLDSNFSRILNFDPFRFQLLIPITLPVRVPIWTRSSKRAPRHVCGGDVHERPAYRGRSAGWTRVTFASTLLTLAAPPVTYARLLSDPIDLRPDST